MFVGFVIPLAYWPSATMHQAGVRVHMRKSDHTMDQIAATLSAHIYFFAGEPEFVHQSEQGLFPLLTPLKGYPPHSLSLEIAGSGIYLDLLVASLVTFLLVGLIVILPLAAMGISDTSKRFGIIATSLTAAFLISLLVLASAVSIGRSLILVWEVACVLLLVTILGVVLCYSRKRSE